MPKNAWITLCLSFGSISALPGGTATVEPRHLPVSKLVAQWVAATEAASVSAGETVRKVLTASDVTLNGTRLEMDPRQNTLTIHGDEKVIRDIQALAKALDLPPVIVQLKCIRLRVDLKAGANAADLLTEGKGGSAVFPAEETTLENLLQKGRESGRIQVISRLDASCASNDEATFTLSGKSGETSMTVVTPLVNSKGGITVSVTDTNGKGESSSRLHSKITMPDGAAALIGGVIEKDAAGNAVEFALLVQAGVLKDGPEASKTGTLK